MVTPSVARRPVAPESPPQPEAQRNPLIGVNAADTLHNGRAVLAFVRDWNCRSQDSSPDEDVELGLELILNLIHDAMLVAGEQAQGIEA